MQPLYDHAREALAQNSPHAAEALRALADGALAEESAHLALDLLRTTPALRLMQGDSAWEERLIRLLRESRYGLHHLLAQRVAAHPDKVLIEVLQGTHRASYSWKRVADDVDRAARATLAALTALGYPNESVAFILNNSYETALLDLGCLSAGVHNVIIPANAPTEHIAGILEKTKVPLVFVSDDTILTRLKSASGRARALRRVVLLRGQSAAHDVQTLDDFMAHSEDFSDEALAARRAQVSPDDLATTMFTSGTTGLPKGILFTHLHLLFKRYARALALPEIGQNDRFLTFLPLFHTFGRFLELMGCLFWGATYVMAESPSIDMLVRGMRTVRPTVFISVPRKWEQLHELVHADATLDPTAELRRLTGGELRWGLSAAGHLSAEVFRFFQANGVELMSGFGMTEATGGITMTPPGRYRPNSLGRALPGVELRLAPDGELLIRGPYVTSGYYGGDEEGVESPFIDGWFATGDIMRVDEEGSYEILDRKKDIYKNSQGETIAPQRVERTLTELDAVEQAFLVGDHRPYNTALIYPAWSVEGDLLREMSESEIKRYFSSILVSANAFLAPHERVLDFRLLPAPLTLERGELTQKGSFRRSIVAERFAPLMDEMYQQGQHTLRWDSIEIRIPTWFFRENGCLNGDVSVDAEGLTLPKLNRALRLERRPGGLKVGDLTYHLTGGRLDLHRLLSDPLNWLGNAELFAFAHRALEGNFRVARPTRVVCRNCASDERLVHPEEQTAFADLLQSGDRSLRGVHLAMLHLRSPLQQHGLAGVRYLSNIARRRDCLYTDLARECLLRPALSGRRAVRRELFLSALRYGPVSLLGDLYDVFAKLDPSLWDESWVEAIAEISSTPEHLAALERALRQAMVLPRTTYEVRTSALPPLTEAIVASATRHPALYRRARELLVDIHLHAESHAVGHLASQGAAKLREGWRARFPQGLVAREDEAPIEEIVTFDASVSPEDRLRILAALQHTTLLPESLYLLYEGASAALSDFPRGGIWVSALGSGPDRASYRLRAQTREGRVWEIALHLAHSLPEEEAHEEVDWLIAASTSQGKLVGAFGAWWPEARLWSEEYVQGETVARTLERALRRNDEAMFARIRALWPYFIRVGAEAYVGLLVRTGHALELVHPSPRHLIAPAQDHLEGARVVSLAARKTFRSFTSFFRNFYRSFVAQTEREHPALAGDVPPWEHILAAVFDALGEREGLALLEQLKGEPELRDEVPGIPPLLPAVSALMEATTARGAVPRPLYFALRRFASWWESAADPTPQDTARVVEDILLSYGLREVESVFPGSRTRFFLETVFAGAHPQLREALEGWAQRQRKETVEPEVLFSSLSALAERVPLRELDRYFLARVAHPHVQPQDEATLEALFSEGQSTADLVVRFEDREGRPFLIRRPTSAREVARLHRLFYRAGLRIEFQPHHRFLVAVSEGGYLIGGLFHTPAENGTVHMEKLVVADPYQRAGIGETLMGEFLQRMKHRGAARATAGFFRPAYFFHLGFRPSEHQGQIVCDLSELPTRREDSFV